MKDEKLVERINDLIVSESLRVKQIARFSKNDKDEELRYHSGLFASYVDSKYIVLGGSCKSIADLADVITRERETYMRLESELNRDGYTDPMKMHYAGKYDGFDKILKLISKREEERK